MRRRLPFEEFSGRSGRIQASQRPRSMKFTKTSARLPFHADDSHANTQPGLNFDTVVWQTFFRIHRKEYWILGNFDSTANTLSEDFAKRLDALTFKCRVGTGVNAFASRVRTVFSRYLSSG